MTAVEGVRERIVSAYRDRSPTSAREFTRSAAVLAGGTTGNLRHFPPYPLYFSGGRGARMVDVDGREYIDCFLCNGPLLLGHRHPAVESAIAAHASVGSMVVNPPLAADIAQEVCAIVPCAERVRFLNSGTEAVLTAVRLARAFTGREKLIKFLGHYHGQDDQFLVGLDPSGAAFGAGVSRQAFSSTALVRYGDIVALERQLAGGDVAAVILDPAMHSGGLWGSTAEFLAAARELTRRHGALLIFDEVITGFRLSLRGGQGHYGVTPDLATYAKALGAGEKLAAVAGRRDVMLSLDPERPANVKAVFQSGTGNDGTWALAAGLAALREYRKLDGAGAYAALHDRSRRLAEGLRAAFVRHGVPAHVNQLGPMLQLFLTRAAHTFEGCAASPSWPVMLFYLALINEGILLSLPTSNHIYLSFAHTDADIVQILAKADAVLSSYDFAALVDAAAAGA